jgi:methylenetetrahydrofolate dehydrogenase (NADP+)/methenyltetrahydrofolate cyclohydrolase
MAAQLLEGGAVAESVLAAVGSRTAEMKAAGVTPGLGTILVGDDPASAGYVRRKHEACQQIGLRSYNIEIPADAGQPALLEAVREFNGNPEVDGYLIQHPVPEGFDFNKALAAIDPDKDADGLHSSIFV